ncbi:hypothetical protein D3C72_2098950 [compost metagenome]
MAVHILGGVEGANLAGGVAGDDDGDFLVEGHEGFEHQRLGRQLGKGGRGVGALADDALALAIIAQARGLEDGGQAKDVDGGVEVG